MRLYLITLTTVLGLTSFAQKNRKEDDLLLSNLRNHIDYLASPKLEGRRAGSAGEAEAANYISQQFSAAGLQPKGSDGFYQPFEIPEGLQVLPATTFSINERVVDTADFFPLAFSANGTVSGSAAHGLQERGEPWFLDLKDLAEEAHRNPHFDMSEAVRKKALILKGKGATALVLHNSSPFPDGLAFDPKDKSERLPFPVFYLRAKAAQAFLGDATATYRLEMTSAIGPKARTGRNVIGYIDNGAPHTVVLGAHYDHLGWGEDGNSLHRDTARRIHHGADDNASGTAALLEIARLIPGFKHKKHNYLFIAFSGEELGLFGSKYFVEHPTLDLSNVSYMINMDMVGRLSDSTHTLTVGGYGTTPLWGKLYGITGKKRLTDAGLKFRFDSSGTGPSDHTSFYRKNIPVLFYFTGLHTDYHKPTDVPDRINYDGTRFVIRHILSLVDRTHTGEKPAFQKTREVAMASSARFSVTLGIMPDYTFSGGGVRVEGVSEGRPAQKAGLVAGDIITALGEHKVTSVENYMQALGKFKKGESTEVSYTRGGTAATVRVTF
ncbi:M28 family peptidase [Flaviaesturariibacter amylovorans]|uniref:PDZ domain-containing protein n=1 Tax=Flaviaesturariibacter amylovorans TaxID=1084520 RepID=A0ABP8HDY5_9BACT